MQSYQENKNYNAYTVQVNEDLQNLSEYNKEMIQRYQSKINDRKLIIMFNSELRSLDFINYLDINKLELENCKNIIPKFESLIITKLEIIDCEIKSIKDFQLQNLEDLTIYNVSDKLESKTLTLEIARFQQLNELYLYKWKIDISPLSQMTRLTKLGLIQCELRSTEAVRQLVNLEMLYLDGNEEIDIVSLQYLNNLTILSLLQCNLKSLEPLRPLTQLKELNISWNSVVYLQPISDLKQITKLNAENNKIIDQESIQQHPNFKNFNLRNQEQPTKEELKITDILRDISNPTTFLKQICKKSRQIKYQYINFRQKVSQLLQETYIRHEQFLIQVVVLSQIMNVFEGCQ
ncbi:leucine-rich_repeat domain-containing protein [Hexamita inflata]|uniref:Leucine-rich repeat domain-containing protein n=1 Tax=Hexamita inflata TaxID=28002 RepID=A0AA86P7N4_9EUKA|nr:leucine-rich repeat domain-containing protein [Hexamita inflata]